MSEMRLAAAIDALVDELVGSGAEIGLQVAVICNGRTVVDAARGVADPLTATSGRSRHAVLGRFRREGADIDSGVAVAVMRNRFDPGELSTVSRIDQLIADELS